MNVARCEYRREYGNRLMQCILFEHEDTIEHCCFGPEGWVFSKDQNVAKQAERIKGYEKGFVAQREHIEELKRNHECYLKELRETQELIIALITGNGDINIDKHGVKTYELFLDDRDIANVAHDDVMSVTYDNKRGGNVYRVRR